MKILTPTSAQTLAEKYFKKLKRKDEIDFARVHSRAVMEIAVMLAKRLGADARAVAVAGWVHDIGKVTARDGHARHSVELLEAEGIKLSPAVRDAILNHGTEGKPKTKEGKILQMADKMSILSVPVLEIVLREKKLLPEDLAFIKKMTSGAVEYLERL